MFNLQAIPLEPIKDQIHQADWPYLLIPLGHLVEAEEANQYCGFMANCEMDIQQELDAIAQRTNRQMSLLDAKVVRRVIVSTPDEEVALAVLTSIFDEP